MKSRTVYVFLLLILPWSSFGQGWVKWSTDTLHDLNPADIEDIDQLYAPMQFAFLAESYLGSELILLDQEGFHRHKIPKHINIDPNGSAIFGSDILIRCKGGVISSYRIYEDRLVLWKSHNTPLKWRSKYLSCTYAFTDEKHAYFFCYYNNNNIKQQAWDHMYAIKYDPLKNRIVKAKSFDLGKDILFAPMSHQQFAFNQDQFCFTTSLDHKKTLFNKDFKEIESVILNKETSLKNSRIVDSIISDKAAPYYLHKPSDLIYHYRNSVLKDLKAAQKVMYVNDSNLLYVQRLSFREQFEMGLLSSNGNAYLYIDSFTHSKHKFSPLSWSRNCYPNVEYQFPLVSLKRMSDSSFSYVIEVWKWYNAQSIPVSVLSPKIQTYLLAEKNYSAVVLASPSFCKACFNQMGIGEEVLVIKLLENMDLASINSAHFKRYWSIKGDIIFIDQEEYDRLKGKLFTDQIYPIIHK
ncbi:MAG: hypothetical protein JXR19_10895 [Bacteroidia bacterium]